MYGCAGMCPERPSLKKWLTTRSAQSESKEEQHQLPPLQDVSEDQRASQARLSRLSLLDTACTPFVYPLEQQNKRSIGTRIGGVIRDYWYGLELH
jgi:hypothetical protein